MSSFSKEAEVKRIVNGREGASIMRRYYLDQKNGGPNRNDISVTANLIVFFLRPAMCAMARMPRREANTYLHSFKERGLFPFSVPEECTTTSSRMTTRNDWVGKLYDYICLHSSTWLGYELLRLWNRAVLLKHGELI